MFEGSYVALITPFTASGLVDESALRQLVSWHRKKGTHGLVPVGTTGESPVLNTSEHRRVLEIVVEEAGDSLPVIAGCGSNSTTEAIEYHAFASDIGASAALHVTGYYNRPNQEGIYQHFVALDQVNRLPIFVYNVPARTVVDIEIDTLVRLSKLPQIVGVKDASKDLSRPTLERLQINKEFAFFSGEDSTAVAYNAAGGSGCISVTANVAPELCAAMQSACVSGDYALAKKIQTELMPLHIALFLEPSPSGVKYACSRLGLCQAKVRLPLVEVGSQTAYEIDRAIDRIDIKAILQSAK